MWDRGADVTIELENFLVTSTTHNSLVFDLAILLALVLRLLIILWEHTCENISQLTPTFRRYRNSVASEARRSV